MPPKKTNNAGQPPQKPTNPPPQQPQQPQNQQPAVQQQQPQPPQPQLQHLPAPLGTLKVQGTQTRIVGAISKAVQAAANTPSNTATAAVNNLPPAAQPAPAPPAVLALPVPPAQPAQLVLLAQSALPVAPPQNPAPAPTQVHTQAQAPPLAPPPPVIAQLASQAATGPIPAQTINPAPAAAQNMTQQGQASALASAPASVQATRQASAQPTVAQTTAQTASAHGQTSTQAAAPVNPVMPPAAPGDGSAASVPPVSTVPNSGNGGGGGDGGAGAAGAAPAGTIVVAAGAPPPPPPPPPPYYGPPCNPPLISPSMGTELRLYLFAQQLYILLTPDARTALIEHLKTLRPYLQQQAAVMADGYHRQRIRLYSPAIHPDDPNAPPDVPVAVQDLVKEMADGDAAGKYLTKNLRHDPDGFLNAQDLMPRLGWMNIDDAKRAIAAAVDIASQQKRAHPADGDGDPNANAKRQRVDYVDSDSQSESESGEEEEEVEIPLALQFGADSDDDGSDYGEGDVMVDDEFHGNVRLNRDWQALPVALRRDKLGRDMERSDFWPNESDSDDDAYNVDLDGLPIVDDDEDDDDDNGDGEGAPYKTWDEAINKAPEEYTGLYDYFLWEKKHKRRAPAIMKRDCLPWVPYIPMAALPTKEMYDPQLPPDGPEGEDDLWPLDVDNADNNGGDGTNNGTAPAAATASGGDGGDGGDGDGDRGRGRGRGVLAVPVSLVKRARSASAHTVKTSSSALSLLAKPIVSALTGLVPGRRNNNDGQAAGGAIDLNQSFDALDLATALNKMSEMQLDLAGVQGTIVGLKQGMAQWQLQDHRLGAN